MNGNPPQIRLVIASLRGGGTQRVCLNLCNGWASQGRRIELVIVTPEGPYLKQLDPRVRRVSMDASRLLKGYWPITRYVRTFPEVPLLVFNCDLAMGLLFFKRLGLMKSPVIYREGNSPRADVKACLRWIYPVLLKHADQIVA